jgi:hypothetical protein
MVVLFGIEPILSSLNPRPQVRNDVPRNCDQRYEAHEQEENAAECEWHRVLLPMNLALGLTGISNICVPFANSTIASVNEQLPFIPSCDVACSEPGFCLRVMDRSCPSIGRYFDAPSFATRNDVYVAFSHVAQIPRHAVLETVGECFRAVKLRRRVRGDEPDIRFRPRPRKV